MCKHTRLYDNSGNKNSNNRCSAYMHAVKPQTPWRTIKRSCSAEGTAAKLVIQGQDHNDRWNCNERQRNNSTCCTAR